LTTNYHINLHARQPARHHDTRSRRTPATSSRASPSGTAKEGKHYIYNHLIFKVLLHGYKETPAALAGVSAGAARMDVNARRTGHG